MALTEMNRNPSQRDLRVFGVLLPFFFALAGFVVRRRTGSAGAAWAVWTSGAAVLAAYLAVPRWRRTIFVAWNHVTYPIGWVVSNLVLAVVFFLVVTPVGLLVRLLGRDPLERRFDRSAPSYWVPRRPEGDVQRYFRQF